jgi:hypothetical protein
MAYSTSLGDSIREEVKERFESSNDNKNQDERSEVNDDDEARGSDNDDDGSSIDPSDELDEIMDQVKDSDDGNNNNQEDDNVQGSPSIDDLDSPFFEGTDVKSVVDHITARGDGSTNKNLEEFLNLISNSGNTNTGDLIGFPDNGGSSPLPSSVPKWIAANDEHNMEGPTDFADECLIIRSCP